MKKYILYKLLFIFIGVVIISCQEDEKYALNEYLPKGGFIEKDFTIESEKYLKNSTEDVELVLNFNRLKGNAVNVTLEVVKTEPESYSSAFTVITAPLSVTKENDTLVVGQFNWSVLKPDSSVYVTLKISDSETAETGTNTESITVEFHKEAAPIISMGKLTYNKYFSAGSSENQSTAIEIEVLDKPAEENIIIPLQGSFELTEGVQFDIDQTLNVPIGSTSAIFNLDVYNSAFDANERGTIYMEIYDTDIPSNLTVELSDEFWFGVKLGKTGEILKLLSTETYEAKINPAFDTDPTKSFELEFKVSDYPVLEDLEIPVKLNQYYAKEGTHFLMPDKILKISAGETTGKIKFDLLPENFNLGDTITLWIELDESFDAGANISYDAIDSWTSLDLIKLDAYIVSLDKAVTYDVLITDVSTTVDVDVVIPNVLDKAAPSDIEIPVQFNEYSLQTGTHFNSDGIIRVNTGETSGTITISVIGSAFAAGESNSLWIEVYDEDMPTNPVLLTNSINWWTTLKVGKN